MNDRHLLIAILDAVIVELQEYGIPDLDGVCGKLDDLIDALKTEEQAPAVDLELWGWINDL